MLRFIAALLVFMTLLAGPAFAQAGDGATEAAPASIAAESAPEDDARMTRRIQQLFSEIDALSNVAVSVEAGVATLTGQTASTEAARRAETLAARVEGVATVENRIQRDVSLGGRVDPALGQAADQLRAGVRALPLLGLAVLVFLAIAGLGWLITGRKALWRRVTPNLFVAELVAASARAVSVVLGVVAALSLLDATALLGALLGLAGVVGLALGFAVKDTIENYVASVMLSIRQPFRPNDHVVIDGKEGRVIRLTSRATVLMTLDGNHLRIPNAAVFKAVILNYTRNADRRFDFKLGVDAADDGEAAARAGVETLKALPFVLGDPEPVGFIEQAGDSTLDLRFSAWINQTQSDFVKSRSAGLAAVKMALEHGGFTLPEPIYRLRFDQPPAPPTSSPGAAGAAAADAPPRPVPKAGPGTESGSEPGARPVIAADTRPDEAIKRRVERERADAGDPDLLSTDAPSE
jgi:small-conductance mechanosensitive channel